MIMNLMNGMRMDLLNPPPDERDDLDDLPDEELKW